MSSTEHLARLVKGFKTWNDWRRENPREVPELCVAKLKWTHLESNDLREADLYRASLSAADLAVTDLTGQTSTWRFLMRRTSSGRPQTGIDSPPAGSPQVTVRNHSAFIHYNDLARGNREGLCREATVPKGARVGLSSRGCPAHESPALALAFPRAK